MFVVWWMKYVLNTSSFANELVHTLKTYAVIHKIHFVGTLHKIWCLQLQFTFCMPDMHMTLMKFCYHVASFCIMHSRMRLQAICIGTMICIHTTFFECMSLCIVQRLLIFYFDLLTEQLQNIVCRKVCYTTHNY